MNSILLRSDGGKSQKRSMLTWLHKESYWDLMVAKAKRVYVNSMVVGQQGWRHWWSSDLSKRRRKGSNPNYIGPKIGLLISYWWVSNREFDQKLKTIEKLTFRASLFFSSLQRIWNYHYLHPSHKKNGRTNLARLTILWSSTIFWDRISKSVRLPPTTCLRALGKNYQEQNGYLKGTWTNCYHKG